MKDLEVFGLGRALIKTLIRFWWLVGILFGILLLIVISQQDLESPYNRLNINEETFLKFSDDSKTLTSIGNSGIRIWAIPTLQLVNNFGFDSERFPSHTVLSPDKQLVFTAEPEPNWVIKNWRVSDKTLLYSFLTYSGSVGTPEFSPDGTLFSVGGQNKAGQTGLTKPSVEIRQVKDGKLVKIFSDSYHASFSPNGKLIATFGDFDISAQLWQVSDNTFVRTLKSPRFIGGGVGPIIFSPDSTLLLTGVIYNSGEKGIQLWRISDGVLIYSLDEFKDAIGALAFSPDGKFFAVGKETYPEETYPDDVESGKLNDSSIELRQVKDGKLVKRLVGHKKDILSMAFSPDGKYLASSSKDDSTLIWPLN